MQQKPRKITTPTTTPPSPSLTYPTSHPWQKTMSDDKITTSTRDMQSSEKAIFYLAIIDTTSKAEDHSGIKNEVTAHIHQLSEVATEEVPIDAIRAIYSKIAKKFTLAIPICFSAIAVNTLGTFFIQSETDNTKYKLNTEQAVDRVSTGRKERDVNTWFHVICSPHETASFQTIKKDIIFAGSEAGITIDDDTFHEKTLKGGVGQAAGSYHANFSIPNPPKHYDMSK